MSVRYESVVYMLYISVCVCVCVKSKEKNDFFNVEDHVITTRETPNGYAKRKNISSVGKPPTDELLNVDYVKWFL